ncbi:MAG: hypothetical protein WC775_01650 [Patescibacteria group bacterium]|jgi:hypothetical protein
MIVSKFKPLIAPLQLWLLSMSRCVGCGKELTKVQRAPHGKGEELVTCECSRIYVYDIKNKSYRRALVKEV